MGRPRIYGSARDKQRAYRARLAAGAQFRLDAPARRAWPDLHNHTVTVALVALAIAAGVSHRRNQSSAKSGNVIGFPLNNVFRDQSASTETGSPRSAIATVGRVGASSLWAASAASLARCARLRSVADA